MSTKLKPFIGKPTLAQLGILQALASDATLSAERAMWTGDHFIGLKNYILRHGAVSRTINIDSVLSMQAKGLVRPVNRQRVRRIKGQRFVSGSRHAVLTAAARQLLKKARIAEAK